MLLRPTIRREIRRRRIRLLLHSTHLYKNLPKILEAGQIESAGALRKRHGADSARRFLHDPVRYERYAVGLDYINCSLTEPNFELLYKRSKTNWKSEWVHLALDLSLLNDECRFSAVSAAKDRGAHVREGVEGLRGMFAEEVDGRARQSLLRNVPTHPQAEVLIPGPIALSNVKAILVSDIRVAEEVQQIVEQRGRVINVQVDGERFLWPERLKRLE